jgi:hypothetical protein
MLPYIVEALKKYDLEQVVRDTGINKWTLQAIRKGPPHGIGNPGILTAEPLYRYFKKREGRDLRRRRAA